QEPVQRPGADGGQVHAGTGERGPAPAHRVRHFSGNSMMKTRRAHALAAAWLFAACTLGPSTGAQAQDAMQAAIVIGQSAPLSGPAAQLGVDFNYGANLHFYEVNRQGGVHGRRIELRVLDDRYEPQRTVENTRRLIEEDKVFALMGY